MNYVRGNEKTGASAGFGARLLALLGGLTILVGLVLNEWVVARLWSPDGALSGRNRAIVAAFDLSMIAAGFVILRLRGRIAGMTKRYLERHSGVAALAVGCLGALTVLACVEVPLYFLNSARDKNPALKRTYSDGFIADHPLLGHRPLPSSCYTETVTLNDTELFTGTYCIDENRCRIVPTQPAQPTDRALLFFGCSFTFGTGVEDEETLPNQVAQLMPDTRVYNFAGVGDGPHQMLAQLTQGNPKELVSERQVTVVYVFIPQHLMRSVMSMRNSGVWGRNDPAFAVGDDDQAQYLGPVWQAHPWRLFFYNLLSHEQILRRMNADWPPAIMERHIRFNTDLVAAASKASHGLFEQTRFIVVFYPLSARVANTLGVDWDQCKKVFEGAGLQVLDYRHLAPPNEEDLFYLADEHPTAEMHRRLAAQFEGDLRVGSIR